MPKNECPYGADDCPKITDLEVTVRVLHSELENMKRILYCIVGILMVELGVTII